MKMYLLYQFCTQFFSTYCFLFFQISDSIKGSDQSSLKAFMSLQYSLYITCFVCVIGGAFFLVAAVFIIGDKAKADKVIHGK